ncbi:SPOR domain-containing protein [bacterium]|nr:SPOR domain-containing protein [bacterium]
MKKFIPLGIFIILIGIIGWYVQSSRIKKLHKEKSTVLDQKIEFDFQDKLMKKQETPVEEKREKPKSVKKKIAAPIKEQKVEIIKKAETTQTKKKVIVKTATKKTVIGKIAENEIEYSIQVASFKDMQEAVSLKEKLSARFQNIKIYKISIPEKGEYFRVMLEPVSQNRVESFKNILKEEYHLTPWIKTLK